MTGTAQATVLGALLLSVASPAHAYLIDLNDATVVGRGRMALELQPIGYHQALIGDEVHELVVPSFQLYWGFGEGWDVLYVARGYALLDDAPPDQSRFTYAQQMIGFRTVLRHGAYSTEEEGEDAPAGPSLVLQTGLFLPSVGPGERGFGANLALLFTQMWDEATVHLNAWASLTPERTFELFLSCVIEGPHAWPVVPLVEVYFDLEDGEPSASGLVGAVISVTDDFALQGGVRVGGWEDHLELEVRLSSWIEWEVWDAAVERQEERAARGVRARRGGGS